MISPKSKGTINIAHEPCSLGSGGFSDISLYSSSSLSEKSLCEGKKSVIGPTCDLVEQKSEVTDLPELVK
jgi:hypothetical protein